MINAQISKPEQPACDIANVLNLKNFGFGIV